MLILFSIIGFFFDKTGTIPGGIVEFLGNAFLFHLSYNGAWWFVLTYVFLVLLSPLLFMLTRKFPAILLVPASGVLYFCAHVFRFVMVPEFSSPIVSWVVTQALLLGTSQFGYIVGMLFRKYRWITKLRTFCKVHSKIMKLAICVIPVVLFLLHCIEQSAIIAPITGIGTIVCFWLWKKPQWVERITLFFGKHSTNIWLAHMFFYSVLFKNFVFIAKYPILIFLLMIAICLLFSIPINGLLSHLRKSKP